MSSIIKLLPCPFCNSAEIVIKNENPKDNSGGYFIECPECGASTSLRFACGDDPTPLLAEQWNRRATSHCLLQIQEPTTRPTKVETLAHYSQMLEEAKQEEAAPAAVAVPDERATFENFMRIDTSGFTLERHDDGSYKEFEVATYWHFWRAALAAIPEADAPVVVHEPDAQAKRTEGIKQVVKMLQKRADDYADEHLSTDPDTGATEGSEAHIEYWNWLVELVDEVCALLAGVSAPAELEAQAVEPSDADLIALNAGERFFSESPSKYPEAGHGTQYHAGALGVIAFGRAALALGAGQKQADARDAAPAALPLAAYLCVEESGVIDFEVIPPCTLPPGEYDLYAKSRTTQAAQQGGAA